MLKRALLFTLLGCCCLAQDNWNSPIAGLLQTDQTAFDHRLAISSPDGNTLAFGTYGGYALFNLSEQNFKWLSLLPRSGRLSPDLNFAYGNEPTNGELWRPVATRWTSYTRGALNGEPIKEWKNDYYILGMDAANNLITTKTSMVAEGKENFIGDMQGLFLMDRKTGKILKTLRNDVLYHRSPQTQSIQFYFNSNLTALIIQTDLDAKLKQVYPFESSEVVQLQCGRLDNPNLEIGERYVLLTGGSSYGPTSYCTLYDLKKGGGEVAGQSYPSQLKYQSSPCEPMIFAFKNDHIFRFDRENKYQEPNLVTEEAVEGGALKIVNQWKVDMRGESPYSKQKYGMTVGKGPTLLIYPISRSAADQTSSANRAYLIDLPSQKLIRYIHPFFNPNAETLAQENRLKVANEEYAANQKKAADDKLAALVKTNWTDKGYVRGRTYFFGSSYVIMDKYDAKEDKFRLWRPQQYYGDSGSLMPAEVITVRGSGLGMASEYPSAKQYRKCGNCEGDGHIEYTEYTTKTKDLPWGYFSGIETKRISTTATNKTKICSDCSGQGVVLK